MGIGLVQERCWPIVLSSDNKAGCGAGKTSTRRECVQEGWKQVNFTWLKATSECWGRLGALCPQTSVYMCLKCGVMNTLIEFSPDNLKFFHSLLLLVCHGPVTAGHLQAVRKAELHLSWGDNLRLTFHSHILILLELKSCLVSNTHHLRQPAWGSYSKWNSNYSLWKEKAIARSFLHWFWNPHSHLKYGFSHLFWFCASREALGLPPHPKETALVMSKIISGLFPSIKCSFVCCLDLKF